MNVQTISLVRSSHPARTKTARTKQISLLSGMPLLPFVMGFKDERGCAFRSYPYER